HLGSSAGLDGSSVTLSALTAKLDASVGLLADMLRKPTFAPADIDRVKTTRIAGIRQEKARPTTAALRVLPPLLYGEDHPYAMPMTGSGTEASVAAISRDDLEAYRRAWVRPENATLVVVGDTTLDKLLPVLNRHLGDWKGEGAAPKAVNVPQVALPSKPRVFLIDQQGAVQANIIAAELVPSTRDPDAVKLAMANDILGGVFSSRLNMNLREDKHWSYGARSMTVDAQNQRPWLAMAPVQIDKTAESIAEARREISDYASGKKPATQDEVTKVVNNELRGQPGAYETAGAVLGTMTGIVRYGRPDNWVQVRNEEIAKLTPAQVADAVKAINPDALTWVVVGDLKKIEAPVRALNLGEVTVVDANGKPVAGKK
ncbi:MAG: insulinase family protein, partial [Xanthomonadales bacterium]|nr:insulinase family protein [Xanthomonadales bacterium]